MNWRTALATGISRPINTRPNPHRPPYKQILIPSSHTWQSNCPLPAMEATMHIHAGSMQLNPLNPYAAAENAAAQRAADVRKKLKSAGDIEGAPSPDEAYMVGHWTDTRQSPPHDDVEYHTSAAGKNSDFG